MATKTVRHAHLAREIKTVRFFDITAVRGLVQPAGEIVTPFRWVTSNAHAPLWIRFVWSPETGTAVLGTMPACFRHRDLIPPSRRYPFGAWVRGFYLPEKQWIGIRPFFWPQKPNDPWNDSHARLNVRIGKALVPLLRKHLPKAKIELDIDNQRLRELTGLRNW